MQQPRQERAFQDQGSGWRTDLWWFQEISSSQCLVFWCFFCLWLVVFVACFWVVFCLCFCDLVFPCFCGSFSTWIYACYIHTGFPGCCLVLTIGCYSQVFLQKLTVFYPWNPVLVLREPLDTVLKKFPKTHLWLLLVLVGFLVFSFVPHSLRKPFCRRCWGCFVLLHGRTNDVRPYAGN